MNETAELVSYFNGRLVPHSQAMAEMKEGEDRSAGGLYDSERTFDGQVFKLREHLDRLYRSLEFAYIDPQLSLEEMETATMEVLEANRPLLGPGDDFIGGQVVRAGPLGLEGSPVVDTVIYCQFIDFPTFALSYTKGVRLVTPSTYSVPAQRNAAGDDRVGQQTLLLLEDDEANITECRDANFIFVTQDRIKLPNRRNVMPGISMATLLELAGSLEIAVDEDDHSASDVYEADEGFVTSTRFCMFPVDTLNGLSLAEEVPGPVTRRLQEAWSQSVGLDFARQALDHLPAEEV